MELSDSIKPKRGDKAVMLNSRVRPEYRNILHKIAEIEGVGVGDLVCEGIARVLSARLEDGSLYHKLEAFNKKESDQFAQERALVDSIIQASEK